MSVDDDTIKRAREIIAAASPPPYTVGTFAGDNHAGHIAIFTEMLALAPAEPKCWTVVIPSGYTPIEEFSLSVAITGNGPTSEANARYIMHSHDSVGGWAACLDEIERLNERQQEHLRHIARLSQTVPLDSEVAEALNQRGALLAEIGTLKAALGVERGRVEGSGLAAMNLQVQRDAAILEAEGFKAENEVLRDLLLRADVVIGDMGSTDPDYERTWEVRGCIKDTLVESPAPAILASLRAKVAAMEAVVEAACEYRDSREPTYALALVRATVDDYRAALAAIPRDGDGEVG